MVLTENTIFRREFFICSTTLSISTVTSMTHPSPEGGGGVGFTGTENE
jgi:hypothetical protein